MRGEDTSLSTANRDNTRLYDSVLNYKARSLCLNRPLLLSELVPPIWFWPTRAFSPRELGVLHKMDPRWSSKWQIPGIEALDWQLGHGLSIGVGGAQHRCKEVNAFMW